MRRTNRFVGRYSGAVLGVAADGAPAGVLRRALEHVGRIRPSRCSAARASQSGAGVTSSSVKARNVPRASRAARLRAAPGPRRSAGSTTRAPTSCARDRLVVDAPAVYRDQDLEALARQRLPGQCLEQRRETVARARLGTITERSGALGVGGGFTASPTSRRARRVGRAGIRRNRRARPRARSRDGRGTTRSCA